MNQNFLELASMFLHSYTLSNKTGSPPSLFPPSLDLPLPSIHLLFKILPFMNLKSQKNLLQYNEILCDLFINNILKFTSVMCAIGPLFHSEREIGRASCRERV